MGIDRVGYISPYRQQHHSVTATLTTEEFQRLKFIADVHGIAPTTYLTNIIRGALSGRLEALLKIAGKS